MIKVKVVSITNENDELTVNFEKLEGDETKSFSVLMTEPMTKFAIGEEYMMFTTTSGDHFFSKRAVLIAIDDRAILHFQDSDTKRVFQTEAFDGSNQKLGTVFVPSVREIPKFVSNTSGCSTHSQAY